MSEIQKTTPAGASSAVVGINPRITAQIRYSIDTGIPGEWHLRVIRSSVPAGKVTGFQTALLDDDVTFITPDDLDDLSGFGCQIADQTVLTREPKFVGDPIALVVAPTARDARVAAALVEVSYEEHAPVFDHLDAIAADAPLGTHVTTPPSRTRPTSTCAPRTAPTCVTGSGSAPRSCRAVRNPTWCARSTTPTRHWPTRSPTPR